MKIIVINDLLTSGWVGDTCDGSAATKHVNQLRASLRRKIQTDCVRYVTSLHVEITKTARRQ